MSFFDDQPPHRGLGEGMRAAAGLGVFLRHGLEPMREAIAALRLGEASSQQQQMVAQLLEAMING